MTWKEHAIILLLHLKLGQRFNATVVESNHAHLLKYCTWSPCTSIVLVGPEDPVNTVQRYFYFEFFHFILYIRDGTYTFYSTAFICNPSFPGTFPVMDDVIWL